MDNKLTYQQARRIRGTKLTDLLADQLLYEPTIGKAIGKTISLKTQARVKRLKERFDPLNIINKLTFGSALATTLFGRMTGREAKDIEYFTGRLTPIRSQKTASKITPTPTMAKGDTDISGINEQLKKIYTFLTVAQENDKQRRDKENNFREEKQLEDEKRHKELIKALTKITGASVPGKAEPVKKGDGMFGLLAGLLGSVGSFIKDMIDGAIKGALKVFDWLVDLKKFLPQILEFFGGVGKQIGNIIRFVGSSLFGTFLGPMLLLGGAAALFTYLYREQKSDIEKNPNDPKYKDNAYAMTLRGEAKTLGEAGEKLRAEAVRKVPRNQVEEFVKSNLTDEELTYQLGANREQLKAWLKDNSKPGSMYQAPVRGALAREQSNQSDAETARLSRQGGGVPVAPTTPSATTPEEEEDKSENQSTAETARLMRQSATPVSTSPDMSGPAGAVPSTASPITPNTAVPTEENESAAETSRLLRQSTAASEKMSIVPSNITGQLNTLMGENVEANMPKRAAEAVRQVVNNVSNLQRGLAPETFRLSEVNIRNDEPTFMRMIMDSTRVV